MQYLIALLLVVFVIASILLVLDLCGEQYDSKNWKAGRIL